MGRVDTPIRRDPDDPNLAQVLDLLHRSFAYMEARIDPPSSLHRLSVQGISAACRDGEVWTIGEPAFACVFLTAKPDRLYLGKLAVDPGHRGVGHARTMIDLAEKRAFERGLPLVELQTRVELVENHAAFETLGFEKVAEKAHPGYDRVTEIVVQRRVASV